jgi:Domain of unknown function (DUF4399)
MRVTRSVALLALPIMMAACTSEPPATTTETAPAATPPAATTTADARPRVFFVEPKDGATVKSPVELKFGVEGIELSPVPPGELKEARPNVGHHHVGVEQDCQAPGSNIVKGTPSWMHFGKAETGMSPGIQLARGKHQLSLQFADDLHNAIPNLCQTITINVE